MLPASHSRKQGVGQVVTANLAGLLAVEQHVTPVGTALAHLAPGLAVSVLVLTAFRRHQICVRYGEESTFRGEGECCSDAAGGILKIIPK